MTRPRNTEHGMQPEYRRGCRCALCVGSKAFEDRARGEMTGRSGYRKREPQPARAWAWARMIEAGHGGTVADRIVRNREVPPRLLALLGRLPIVDEASLE